jgi:thiosulfate dehydrogenase [quinone] large subunit
MATTQIDADVLGSETTLSVSGPWIGYWFALLRVMVGYWFVHAGLTKVLFGFDAQGYLQYASAGAITEPLMQPFASGLGLAFVNLAIPFGELLIGLGLMVGALVRLASFFGAFLMAMFYFTNHGWAHGFTNGDLWGLLLFVTMIVVGAGRVWGLDAYLEKTHFVQRNKWLRYLLG